MRRPGLRSIIVAAVTGPCAAHCRESINLTANPNNSEVRTKASSSPHQLFRSGRRIRALEPWPEFPLRGLPCLSLSHWPVGALFSARATLSLCNFTRSYPLCTEYSVRTRNLLLNIAQPRQKVGRMVMSHEVGEEKERKDFLHLPALSFLVPAPDVMTLVSKTLCRV